MKLKNKSNTLVIVIVVAVVLVYAVAYVGVPLIKEANAVKKVRELGDSPQQLAIFLEELEKDYYNSEKVQEELSKLNLSVEDKISIQSKVTLWYYSIPKITKSEVEAYVKKNGSSPLYMESGKGGFYDGKEDASSKKTVGLSNSPLYEAYAVKYFGDFYELCSSGVELNNRYEEEYYSNYSYYFKDKKIEFDPRKYDCYYSGKYLFAIGTNESYVFDMAAGKTLKFSK